MLPQQQVNDPSHLAKNRRFPETTGEYNLTVFSYSGRVKSPEWRRQLRRADLRHFEIFRHGPIVIYTRLPAGGTYNPICTFPASSECFIGISDAFSAFCLRVSVIFPTCSLYPQQLERVPTLRYTCRHAPTGRFSKAGLQEWMCFVIFRAESRSALLGRFLSRRCFTLCITVEAEPRIAKPYKCQYCWVC